MRFFVAWDDAEEADLIALYLGAGENKVVVRTGPTAVLEALTIRRDWDAILFPIPEPDDGRTLEAFLRVRRELPDCPMIGACQLRSMIRLAGFLANGMRSYVVRDEAKDFIFLLPSTVTGTVEAVHAERERLISTRLRDEVDSVRQLQEAMIPDELPMPAGYRICGRYEASQLNVLGGRPVILAGGDYYDVFQGDADDTFVLLGDAAGHGMKACLSIMIMHTLVQMIRDRSYQDTATFVTAVNRHLCAQPIIREGGGFITLLFGRLNSRKHEFEWTSAGHPVPLRHCRHTDTFEPLGSRDDGGLALGILEDAEYESLRSEVPPGSRLLIYTDGLDEAFPSGQDRCRQFGMDGITRTMRTFRESLLEDAMQALFDTSHAHTEGAGRHDDTTVVMIDRV